MMHQPINQDQAKIVSNQPMTCDTGGQAIQSELDRRIQIHETSGAELYKLKALREKALPLMRFVEVNYGIGARIFIDGSSIQIFTGQAIVKL